MQSSNQRGELNMKKKSFGSMIAALRKEKGMTQLDLAEKMGVTDKAVSKWERDLSFPDVHSIPKLAEIFDVTVDELMQVKTDTRENVTENRIPEMIQMVLKSIALAMGIAVVVLSWMKAIDTGTAVTMLGMGLACMAVTLFSEQQEV